MPEIHRFLVVDSLLPRYTIVVSTADRTTSVWCDECEMWVAEWDEEWLSRHDEDELLEAVVSEHRSDFPEAVNFK